MIRFTFILLAFTIFITVTTSLAFVNSVITDIHQKEVTSYDDVSHKENSRKQYKAKRLDKKFNKIDQDGNGVISKSEFKAFYAKKHKRMDKNKDGEVTEKERKAHIKSKHDKHEDHKKEHKE